MILTMRGYMAPQRERHRQIPKGRKPGDIPYDQLTKFALIIDLKTAKTLGLSVPLELLARADEAIE
jgi:putative ABC transport system substrate-binding protein